MHRQENNSVTEQQANGVTSKSVRSNMKTLFDFDNKPHKILNHNEDEFEVGNITCA